MSESSDIVTGIGAMLAAATIGVWNPGSVYPGTGVWIVPKVMPTAPDRCIVLNWVNQGDNITLPSGQGMLQVRARGAQGNPLDVDDLLDSVRNVLHGTQNLVFGTTTLVQLNRQVVAPLGEDDLKRWERADQYYSDIAVAPTTLRPASGSW